MNKKLIQEMIDTYMQAERDVLNGKSITFRGRTMSSEDLDEIRKGRAEWEQRLAATQAGASRFAAKYAAF